MKSTFFIALLIFVSNSGYSQEEWRSVTNNAFQPGEVLKYRFYYDALLTGKVTAGIGTIEVKKSKKEFNGRKVFHIDSEGRSKGMFNWFFKVIDQFDSYVDEQFLAPHFFERRTREGGYKKDDEYRFNHSENYVITRSDSISIPKYTQDFLSAVYFARTFETDTLEIGDVLPINFFLDDSVYNSAIVFDGREIIKIELGVFQCLKFRPGMATGEVFSNQYPMELWVTDDKNHIPLLGKSAVIVGTVKAELIEFKGLANPLTSLIGEPD
ncbi:MAG: DUF3108 domain-containing protein [Bacteroidales bacterium]